MLLLLFGFYLGGLVVAARTAMSMGVGLPAAIAHAVLWPVMEVMAAVEDFQAWRQKRDEDEMPTRIITPVPTSSEHDSTAA